MFFHQFYAVFTLFIVCNLFSFSNCIWMLSWKVNMHDFFLWSISWKSRWSEVIHLNLQRSFFFPPLHASHDLSVIMKLKWGPKAVARKTRRPYKPGFYGTFKECKWKTVFALLITKNASLNTPPKPEWWTCAIKKPRGMRAVCSPCPASVPGLRFHGNSQTICAPKEEDMLKRKTFSGK